MGDPDMILHMNLFIWTGVHREMERQTWPQTYPLPLACAYQASLSLQDLGSEPCDSPQILLLSGWPGKCFWSTLATERHTWR